MQESHDLPGSPHTQCVPIQLIRASPFKAGPTGLGSPSVAFSTIRQALPGLMQKSTLRMGLHSETVHLATKSESFIATPLRFPIALPLFASCTFYNNVDPGRNIWHEPRAHESPVGTTLW